MFKIIEIIRNTIDYPLRQIFRWKRPGLRLKNELKSDMFDDLPCAERREADQIALHLLQTFHLDYIYNHSSIRNYRQNLYYLDLLEKALNPISFQLPQKVFAADIGVSNWFYVHALYSFFLYWQCQGGRTISLEGYEADAFRVYDDLFSRFDYALGYSSPLKNAVFIPKRFYKQSDKFDIVTQFFPFIFLRDHLFWGLPPSLFSPQRLLEDVWNSLKPSGILLIVNQGENEQKAQIELLSNLGIEIFTSYLHDSLLYHYSVPRYVTIVRRDG